MWRWFDQITDQEQLRRLELLKCVPLFANLNRRQLGRLLPRFYEKSYAANETIFDEGEPGKALFVVLKGHVTIRRATDGGHELLASVTDGGYFGELALIDDEPRFATATTEEPSLLLILYKTDFDHLIEGHRRIAIRVMGNLLKTLATYVRKAELRRNAHGPASLPRAFEDDCGKDLP